MPSSSLLDINTLQLVATFSLPQTIYEASSTLRLAIAGTRRVFLVPRSISFQEIQRAHLHRLVHLSPAFFCIGSFSLCLAALEVLQNFLGSLNDRWRQAGQPSDVNSIAVTGGPFDQIAQKNDVALPFLNRKVEVPDPFLGPRQIGELVIVRRKKSARSPRHIMKALRHGPGDRDPVKRARAPTHFIEQDEATLSCMTQDIRGLLHLHHESRLSARQ